MTEHPPSYPTPTYAGPTYAGPVDPSWPPPYLDPEPEPDYGPLLKDAVVVLGSMIGLGILCGVLWTVLVEPPQLIRYEGGVGRDAIQMTRIFGMDGWYAVIAAGAALVAGLGFGLWRRRDPLATLLLVLGGSVLAAFFMLATGQALGPQDPTDFLMSAPLGTSRDVPLEVVGAVTYIAWPLPALIGQLIALVSRTD